MTEEIQFCKELNALAADMVDDKGETMKRWDEIRSQVTRLPGSDLPRLNFESLMEGIAEKITEAAALLDVTETGCQALFRKDDELKALVGRLTEALLKYGRHTSDCPTHRGHDCLCGIEELRTEIGGGHA